MIFTPKWYRLLPNHIRPQKKQKQDIEIVRKAYNLDHELLFSLVAGSKATTRKVLRSNLNQFRIQAPDIPESELLERLFLHRKNHSPYPALYDSELLAKVTNSKTFNQLCDIISEAENEIFDPNIRELQDIIDGILVQEKNSFLWNAELLIREIQIAYDRIRDTNSERDEHWFLAQTYLERYESQMIQQGKESELRKFIAYKDTHLFAMLDHPNSIRALCLYLVHQEFGDKYSEYYITEFNLLMEKVMTLLTGEDRLTLYRNNNPVTYSENQHPDESLYSLHYLINAIKDV